jgi:hypothetical protein
MSIARSYDFDSYLLDTLTAIRSLDDPDYGDPAEWPAWTDSGRWGLGPEPADEPLPPELAPVDPDPADARWLNEQPSLDDWLEYRAWSRWVEMKDRERLITEDDVRAAGLPI